MRTDPIVARFSTALALAGLLTACNDKSPTGPSPMLPGESSISGPRADVSGTYTLTITAADDCRVGLDEGHLPEEARVRSYTATVSQHGPDLEAALSGARFIVYDMTGDRFRGRSEPGGAMFSLSWEGDDFFGFYPNLVEQLTTSTVFVLTGSVVAAGPTDRVAGMLDGALYVAIDWDPRPSLGWRPIAWCSSARHQFVLSR